MLFFPEAKPALCLLVVLISRLYFGISSPFGGEGKMASGKRGVKMERGSCKNPHCLRRSRVVRILDFRANILAELSEALKSADSPTPLNLTIRNGGNFGSFGYAEPLR